MTSSSRESVASGRPHLVVEVSGGQPVDLDDFVGDVSFVSVVGTQTYRIEGTGARNDAGVRFFEKDAAGKDLRTWQVTATDAGDFEAQAVSNY
jgi:hypothetical protein